MGYPQQMEPIKNKSGSIDNLKGLETTKGKIKQRIIIHKATSSRKRGSCFIKYRETDTETQAK